MIISEIKEMFLTSFNSKPYEIKRAKNTPDRPDPNCEHHIYSYVALPVLLNRLKALAPNSFDDKEIDQLNRYSVRYIVDTSGTLWFAQEGETGRTVPAHSDMRNPVYAAGNIFFSDDYQSIVKITNKSGHFKPPAATLVWAIAAFLSVEAPFDSEITIEFQETENEPIKISYEELCSLLPTQALPISPQEFIIEVRSNHKVNQFTNINEFNDYKKGAFSNHHDSTPFSSFIGLKPHRGNNHDSEQFTDVIELKNRIKRVRSNKDEIVPLNKTRLPSCMSQTQNLMTFFQKNTVVNPQDNCTTPPSSPRNNR